MKVFVVLMCAVLGYAQGFSLGYPTGIYRTPQFDSAVIEMQRVGGNFAYKSTEGHAYAISQPVIQNVPTPIGETYEERPIIGQVTYHEPAQAAVIAPAPVPVAPAPIPVAPAPVPIAPAYFPAAPAPAPIYGDHAPVASPDYRPISAPLPIAPAPGPIQGSYPSGPAMDAPAQDFPAAPAPISDSSDDSVTIESA